MVNFPKRVGPRPDTYKLPPHTQLDARPVPELIAALADHCFSLPSVHEEPTRISVPGARGLVADSGVAVAIDLLMVEREFAHIHPDGSMHVVLAPDDALAAIEAGWAEPHPMAAFFNPGMVMLYTPRDHGELDVITALVDRCWSYVFGRTPK
jgi:phospholipase/carboxylesterase